MKIVRRRCGAAVCFHEGRDPVEAPSPGINNPVLPDSAVKRRTSRISEEIDPLPIKSFDEEALHVSEFNIGYGSPAGPDQAITGEAFEAMPEPRKREWHEHIAIAIGGFMHAVHTRICGVPTR